MGDAASARAAVRRELALVDVRPSKRWGQNFLVDEAVAESVAAIVQEMGGGDVVEIGPGLGALTWRVGRAARRLVALEIDRRLAEWLASRVEIEGLSNVQILRCDALEADYRSLGFSEPLLVVGSIPYSITAPLLQTLVRQRDALIGAVLVTQREVAAKIAASPGPDGTSLGTLIRAYADVSIRRSIAPRAFEPVPDVASSLWTMTFLKAPRFRSSEEAFFQVVRAIYGARRKTLRNALSAAAPIERVIGALADAGIDPGLRGETLGFDELDRIASALGGFEKA